MARNQRRAVLIAAEPQAMARRQLRLMQVDLGRGWAGGQTQSFALAQGLAARGHEVIFVCQPRSELARRISTSTIHCAEVRAGGRLDLAALVRLAGLLRRTKPQIVHAHDSLSFWLAGLAARLSRFPVRVVVHKRTDHLPGRFGRFRYNHFADRVIAISGAARESLLKASVAEEKVALIYSSVDSERFTPKDGSLAAGFREEMGFSAEWPLVGTIGTLAARKGQTYLLEAARTILQSRPETRFLICGRGPLQASLKARAQELGVGERVVFLGERDDVRPLLAALQVFVLPSLAEGLGVSALEAMAVGKPVVASRVGGLAEVVEDGRTGFLVSPGQAEQLTAAITRLLEDASLREILGKNARLRVETVFSRERMIERTEEVYYSCCSR